MRLLLIILLALGAASCASPARPKRAVAARTPLSPEERKQIDRKFYEAVDAYMKTDYTLSSALIREILSANPGHPDARSLLVRVKAVERVSAAP